MADKKKKTEPNSRDRFSDWDPDQQSIIPKDDPDNTSDKHLKKEKK